jgi:hypothetical protein
VFGASVSLTFPIHVSDGGAYCPVDCVVSDWTDWSQCSAECGGGTRTRARSIEVDPLRGGQACPDLEETEACNTQECPPVCPNDCSGNGTCLRGDVCACDPGYTLEDCSRHRIEHILLLDGSGSIRPDDFTEMKNALTGVTADPAILPLDGSVSIGVVLFSDNAQTVYPLSAINATTLNAMRQAINNMRQPNGTTNTKQGLIRALDMLVAGHPDATKVVDVITDGSPTGYGAPTNWDPCVGPEVQSRLASLDDVHVIGVGTNWQPQFLECIVKDPATDIIGVDTYPTLEETLRIHLPEDYQTAP